VEVMSLMIINSMKKSLLVMRVTSCKDSDQTSLSD
jgi:hypothetical protein